MNTTIKTGEELKASRKRLNYSQERFAALCDVSRNTVANWENSPKLPFILSLGLSEFVWSLTVAKQNERHDNE